MIVGVIGYKNHARRLISIIENRCDKIFVYYPDLLKLESNFDGSDLACRIVKTSNYEDLMLTDCVFISSPTSTHSFYLTNILSNYKGYIYSEKPPCSKKEELKELYSIDEQRKKHIYFNFNYRYSVLGEICKKALNDGGYGALISMQFNSSHGLACNKSYITNWRNKADSPLENIIGNVGIHYIDLVYYLLDFKFKVTIDAVNVSQYSSNPDSALITILSNRIMPISIYLSYAAPFRNSAVITFSDAILELNNGCVTIQTPRDSFNDEGMFAPATTQEIAKFSDSRSYYNDSLDRSVDNFINMVKSGNSCSLHDYDAALNATATVFDTPIELERL